MSIRKKLIAAVLSAALLVTGLTTVTGCADTSYAAVIDGTSIPAGVYIYNLFSAAGDASAKVGEANPDLDTTKEGFTYFDYKVGDMTFSDYVKQETLDLCKRYVAVENMFDELGLSLTADDKSAITEAVNSAWDEPNQYAQYYYGYNTFGEYYEKCGIGKNSYKSVLTNQKKEEMIFDAYYGESGKEPVTSEEIKNYIVENYALVRYIDIKLTDADGNVIEDETTLSEKEALANGYVDELNGGAKFSAVLKEYNDSISTSTTNKPDEEKEVIESDNDRIFRKTSTSPSAEFVSYVFEQGIGKASVLKTDTHYYVIMRYDITQKSDENDYIDMYKSTSLHAMKDDAFDAAFEAYYAAYTVETNDNAINRYTPESYLN